MAINWSNVLQGAIRGGFPNVAASVDQGRNIQSIMQSRQFQDLLNQARLVAQNRQMQWQEEDRSLLTPEERKQKLLDPAGYRQLRSGRATTTKTDLIEQAAKLKTSLNKMKDEETGDVPPEWEQHTKNALAEISRAINEIDTPADNKRAAMFSDTNRSGFPPLEDTLGFGRKEKKTVNSAKPGPGAYGGFGAGTIGAPPTQRTDNRGMFTAGVNPFQAPPKTLSDLGISDPQSQQVFSEIEKKVPNLRDLYTGEPETFQRLFAAINSGKVTQAEVIDKLNELYGTEQ